MKTEKIKVTPAMAKKYLATNPDGNRKVRWGHVKMLANEMKEGRWQESTGENIKFDINGKMFDGQHRMLAVVEANMSFYFDIVTGLRPDVVNVIDTGANRSTADTFQIRGIANSTALSAGIKFYHQLLNNRDASESNARANFSSSHAVELYEGSIDHWAEVNSITLAWYRDFNKIISPAFIFGNYAYILEKSKHSAKAIEFFSQVFAKLGAPVDSRIALLRTLYLNDKSSTKKMSPFYKQMYFNICWNAYVTDKQIRRIFYNPEMGRVEIV